MDILISNPIKRSYADRLFNQNGFILIKMNVQIFSVHRPRSNAASLIGILLVSLLNGIFWGAVVMLAGWSGGLFVMMIATLLTFLGIALCHGNSVDS
jgi:hypothetical protein